MKKFINSGYMTWFRIMYLNTILSEIVSEESYYCCHSALFYSLFLCWKDLKEVEDNMDSTNLKLWKTSKSFTCSNSWFENKEDRVAFLQECLNKFNK